ncbi:MAG: hypothetical protein CSA38_01910 [Flavobacteriales bacterium]|nr:MAG: hypothetical protein CSA38_01910 [Flavobacteriales bacterium]
MNIVPLTLSKYLSHYLYQEFEGLETKYGNIKVKVISIDCHSSMGKYIISNLKRIDYPLKNLQKFNVFIELKQVKKKTYCTKQKVYKVEDYSTSFIEVPDTVMKDINQLFGDLFRQNFYFFVQGYMNGEVTKKKVENAIRFFMDKYFLWDYFDVESLRRLYYRMLNNSGSKIQKRSSYRK